MPVDQAIERQEERASGLTWVPACELLNGRAIVPDCELPIPGPANEYGVLPPASCTKNTGVYGADLQVSGRSRDRVEREEEDGGKVSNGQGCRLPMRSIAECRDEDESDVR